VVWAAYAEAETRRLQYTHRESVFKPAVFPPLVVPNAQGEPVS
jgi:hypothetical protein